MLEVCLYSLCFECCPFGFEVISGVVLMCLGRCEWLSVCCLCMYVWLGNELRWECVCCQLRVSGLSLSVMVHGGCGGVYMVIHKKEKFIMESDYKGTKPAYIEVNLKRG